MGLTLVKKLLFNGYRVAPTSRDGYTLSQAVGVIDKDSFTPLTVDLNNQDSIDESVNQTLTAFGRVDVVVSNPGYRMTGTVEEISEQEITELWENLRL